MSNRPIDIFTTSLFQHGIEKYDSEKKISTNIGGAQIFQLRNWKAAQSPIHFNVEEFGKCLRGLAATLFTVNRVQLDPTDKPVKLASGKNKRINNGLLLYMQYGEDGQGARDAAQLLKEECEVIKDNISAVVDLLPTHPELKALENVYVPMFDGNLYPMNINKVILLAVSSGSPNSSQFWSFMNLAAKTPGSLSDATVAKDKDLSDLGII